MIRILLLFLTFTFTGELEVEGDLKITGNIEVDGSIINQSEIAFVSAGQFELYVLTKTNELYRLMRNSGSGYSWYWESNLTPPPVDYDEITHFTANSSMSMDGIGSVFIFTQDGGFYVLNCILGDPCDDDWYSLQVPWRNDE
jgi:hypothetical protein